MSTGRFGTEHGDRADDEADQCDRYVQADNHQKDRRRRRDFDPCDNGRIQRFTLCDGRPICSLAGHKRQRDVRGQRIDQRTIGRAAGIAATHSVRQHSLQRSQIGNPCSNIGKVAGSELAYFGAGESQKRKKLVWEIEWKLAEDGARPIIFYDRRAKAATVKVIKGVVAS